MFLGMLSDTEKAAFFKLAIYVVNSDGYLHSKEKQLLDLYAHEMGLTTKPDSQSIGNESIEEIAREFTNSRSRNIAYVELLGLSTVDGEYAELENDLLDAIRRHLGISTQQHHNLYDWVKRLAVLYGEGLQLLNA